MGYDCAYGNVSCGGGFRSESSARWHSTCPPGRAVSLANRIAKEENVANLDVRNELLRTARLSNEALELIQGSDSRLGRESRENLEKLAAARLLARALEIKLGPIDPAAEASLITSLALAVGAELGDVPAPQPSVTAGHGEPSDVVRLVSLELRERGRAPVGEDIPGLLVALGLADAAQEQLWVISVDALSRVRNVVEVARGSMIEVDVPLPVLFAAVLTVGTEFFLIAHNHPSGDAHPSSGDFDLTATVLEAANIIGLYFLDHLIAAPSEPVFSFFDHGLLQRPPIGPGHDRAYVPPR